MDVFIGKTSKRAASSFRCIAQKDHNSYTVNVTQCLRKVMLL